MLDKVVKWGDSIEAAVKLALNDLKLSEDEVEIEVLEQPTKGFLGFHKKLAKVSVTRKPEPEKKPAAEPERIIEKPVEEPVPETVSVEEVSEEIIETTEEAEEQTEEIRSSFFPENAYVIADPQNNAAEEDSEESDSEEEEQEEEKVEILKPVKRRRNDRRKNIAPISMHTKFTITEDDADAVPADDSFAAEFVKQIIDQMGLHSVDVKASVLDDVLYISLTGEEVGSLIGKRGSFDIAEFLRFAHLLIPYEKNVFFPSGLQSIRIRVSLSLTNARIRCSLPFSSKFATASCIFSAFSTFSLAAANFSLPSLVKIDFTPSLTASKNLIFLSPSVVREPVFSN